MLQKLFFLTFKFNIKLMDYDVKWMKKVEDLLKAVADLKQLVRIRKLFGLWMFGLSGSLRSNCIASAFTDPA